MERSYQEICTSRSQDESNKIHRIARHAGLSLGIKPPQGRARDLQLWGFSNLSATRSSVLVGNGKGEEGSRLRRVVGVVLATPEGRPVARAADGLSAASSSRWICSSVERGAGERKRMWHWRGKGRGSLSCGVTDSGSGRAIWASVPRRSGDIGSVSLLRMVPLISAKIRSRGGTKIVGRRMRLDEGTKLSI